MSKTQQEIAAPQARKIYQNITITALSILLTAISTFLIYAYQSDMFSSRTALAITITVVLSLLVIAALVTCILLKTAKIAAVFGFFAVTIFFMLFALIIMDKASFIIFGYFTSTMLFLLFTTILFLSIAIFIATQYKNNPLMLVAVINCAILSISMTFCCMLRVKTKEIWTVSAFIMIIFALICVVACFAAKDKKIVTTKWITYCATFTALSIVLKIMGNALSFVEVLKFSIVYIPWVISGIVLGPVGGMITACVSDILGQLIFPSGFGINPIITLANTLFPLFPTLMYKYSPIKQKWLNIFIGMLISTIVCTLTISTFGQWIYDTSIPFWTRLVGRLFQPIVIAVNYLMIIGILPALNRAKLINLSFIKQTQNK